MNKVALQARVPADLGVFSEGVRSMLEGATNMERPGPMVFDAETIRPFFSEEYAVWGRGLISPEAQDKNLAALSEVASATMGVEKRGRAMMRTVRLLGASATSVQVGLECRPSGTCGLLTVRADLLDEDGSLHIFWGAPRYHRRGSRSNGALLVVDAVSKAVGFL